MGVVVALLSLHFIPITLCPTSHKFIRLEAKCFIAAHFFPPPLSSSSKKVMLVHPIWGKVFVHALWRYITARKESPHDTQPLLDPGVPFVEVNVLGNARYLSLHSYLNNIVYIRNSTALSITGHQSQFKKATLPCKMVRNCVSRPSFTVHM